MKILILKPSSLGDVVQAIPVLRLVKRHLPQAEIHWWIDSRLAPLLEGDPDLAGLVRFDRQRWAAPSQWPELFRMVRWLRAQQFDWVIDLQSLARSGAFAWLANGKFLIGLDETREGARGFYDVAVRRASYHTHAVDWYLAVLPHLRVPVNRDFIWLPPRPEIASAVKEKWNADGARWIALQPGARWENKRWPAEHYVSLAKQLAGADPAAKFVVLGASDDSELGKALAAALSERCLDLTGRTTLPEMIEWLRLCELLITNDTGPMHVAAALGKPVVAMFGPTEPRRTGPYGQIDGVLRHSLPCSPCMKSSCHYVKPLECLKAIPPARVFERAGSILARAS